MHYFILINYILLTIITVAMFLSFKKRGINLIGASPIDSKLFFMGKFSLFLCWLMPALVLSKKVPLPSFIEIAWIGEGLFLIGFLLFAISVLKMGHESLRMGLPQGETVLKTCGPYRFSRNPMYLGFIFISLGSSCIAFFPITWLLAILSILIHHKVILSEEKFLAERFGDDWKNYCLNAGRYFIF